MRIEQKCSCGAELTLVAQVDREADNARYPTEWSKAKDLLDGWENKHSDCEPR